MKLLIVDDQKYSRSFMCEVVKDMDIACKAATSTDHAKELLEEESFDGLICDYHLGPGQFASELIQYSGLPGVIVTADPDSAKLDLSKSGLVAFGKGDLLRACDFLVSLIQAQDLVLVESTPTYLA